MILLAAVSLAAAPVAAQDPQLRPLSSQLAAFEGDSLGVFRYVVRRCAALYMVTGAMLMDREPELASVYQESGASFGVMATNADVRLGTADQNEAAEITIRAISEITAIYQARMNRNMALTGSYYADDPLIREDVEVCRSLIESGS